MEWLEAVLATNVHLSSELERFARECVEAGRYNNVSEVVRSALRMLQDAEERRRHFQAMLRETEDEAIRDGGFSLESVLAELDRIIDDPTL
jgi:antitoxin ParD1/3/4